MLFAFFALRAQREGDAPLLKVLQAPPLPPYNAAYHGWYDGTGFGIPRSTGAGLPHMRAATFSGEYPFARIDFADPDMPVQVALEAWNPTIPHEADDSGIPVAIFVWKLTNPGSKPVDVTLAGNLPVEAPPGKGTMTVRREHGLTALQVAFNQEDSGAPNAGTLAMTTPWAETTSETHWKRATWYTSLMDWGERLLATGRLNETDEPAMGRRCRFARISGPPPSRRNRFLAGLHLLEFPQL